MPGHDKANILPLQGSKTLLKSQIQNQINYWRLSSWRKQLSIVKLNHSMQHGHSAHQAQLTLNLNTTTLQGAGCAQIRMSMYVHDAQYHNLLNTE